MTRVFLVGAGAIARFHAAAAGDRTAIPEPVEVHVTDTNPGVLADFMAQFPDAVEHPDVTEMLSGDRQLDDVAIIATPPFTHFDLARRALEAGLHVLCEKPLAMDVEQSSSLAALADELGLVLEGCDSRFRDVATTQRVRQAFASGVVGRPYHVTFVNKSQRSRSGFEFQSESGWFRDPRLSGGGVLMDWGPYDIAVLDEVLQPTMVEILDAWVGYPHTGGPFEADSDLSEQHAGAAMRITRQDGTTVTVTYERAACTHGTERADVEIEGTAGAVNWDWLDWVGSADARFTHDEDGAVVTEAEHHPTAGPGFHARPLTELLTALRAGTVPRERTARTAFAFEWLRSIVDAARTGRPITIRYPDVNRLPAARLRVTEGARA